MRKENEALIKYGVARGLFDARSLAWAESEDATPRGLVVYLQMASADAVTMALARDSATRRASAPVEDEPTELAKIAQLAGVNAADLAGALGRTGARAEDDEETAAIAHTLGVETKELVTALARRSSPAEDAKDG